MDHSTEFPNFLRTSPPAHVPRETSHVVSLLLLATYRSNMEVVKVGEAGANRRKTVSGQKLLSLETGAKATGADKERMLRYSRGEGNKSKGVTKHRLKLKLKRGEKKISMASKRAAQAEILLPTQAGGLEAESEMEKTARVSQRQIAEEVDLQTQRKAYNMTLDRLGPYRVSYTADGKHVLLGGRKGHVAIVKPNNAYVKYQLQLRETVRDLTFLRDHTMFAVAQHKHLFIYDETGTELHCLRTHKPDVARLGFLRYHWMLATIGSAGRLRYLDVSTGKG